jgi:hypothetical protein
MNQFNIEFGKVEKSTDYIKVPFVTPVRFNIYNSNLNADIHNNKKWAYCNIHVEDNDLKHLFQTFDQQIISLVSSKCPEWFERDMTVDALMNIMEPSIHSDTKKIKVKLGYKNKEPLINVVSFDFMNSPMEPQIIHSFENYTDNKISHHIDAIGIRFLKKTFFVEYHHNKLEVYDYKHVTTELTQQLDDNEMIKQDVVQDKPIEECKSIEEDVVNQEYMTKELMKVDLSSIAFKNVPLFTETNEITNVLDQQLVTATSNQPSEIVDNVIGMDIKEEIVDKQLFEHEKGNDEISNELIKECQDSNNNNNIGQIQELIDSINKLTYLANQIKLSPNNYL